MPSILPTLDLFIVIYLIYVCIYVQACVYICVCTHLHMCSYYVRDQTQNFGAER